MTHDYRTQALILLEIGEIAAAEEHRMQATALAKMWLSLAVLEESRAPGLRKRSGASG
jgi:hypothetical protein